MAITVPTRYPAAPPYCQPPPTPLSWRTSASSNRSSCRPDTLLYIGADVDVHMLKLMQPWERHAIFVDSMTGDGFVNVRQGDDVLDRYLSTHRYDGRPSWRTSSAALRPCTQLRCAAPLTRLLQARMEEDPAFTRVRVAGNLSLRFELRSHYGLVRSLRYYVTGADVLLKRGLIWKEMPYLRVSTIAMPGSAGMASGHELRTAFRQMLPSCLCYATIVASPGERSILGSIGAISGERQHRYASGDTLSGRRRRRRRLSAEPVTLPAGDGAELDHTTEGDDTHGRVSVFCVDVGADPAQCSEREGAPGGALWKRTKRMSKGAEL